MSAILDPHIAMIPTFDVRPPSSDRISDFVSKSSHRVVLHRKGFDTQTPGYTFRLRVDGQPYQLPNWDSKKLKVHLSLCVEFLCKQMQNVRGS